MKRWSAALLVGVGMVVTAGFAWADFVDAEIGARGLSMGGAFVAMDGDPASLFWNPAAIRTTRKVQVTGTHTRLFGNLEDVSENFVGITGRAASMLTLGFGWSRTGLKDVYHEDVLTFGLAADVWSDRLTLGVTGLFYGAEAPGYEALNDPNYDGAQWEPSLSVGALYRLNEKIQLGASFENLLRPEMQLLSNTTDVDQIGGRRRFGARYVLQEIVILSGEVRHYDFPEYVDKSLTFHVGAESWFSEVLALRVGVDEGNLTAGAGLLVKKVRTDLALVTSERLGNTYRAGVTVGF